MKKVIIAGAEKSYFAHIIEVANEVKSAVVVDDSSIDISKISPLPLGEPLLTPIVRIELDGKSKRRLRRKNLNKNV